MSTGGSNSGTVYRLVYRIESYRPTLVSIIVFPFFFFLQTPSQNKSEKIVVCIKKLDFFFSTFEVGRSVQAGLNDY